MLLALLVTINSGDASALTDRDREICLAVAKRQAQMYDAKIKSDWQAIYSLLTNEYRSQKSFEKFVARPHLVDDERPKKLSGAQTAPEIKNKRYMPPHLGYRLTDFYISEDKKMVKVVSQTTLSAPQFVGPITTNQPDEEFWIKTANGWKAQWDTKYLIHASGAATSLKTPRLPRFTTHVKAPELASWFVNEAQTRPDGKKRDAA